MIAMGYKTEWIRKVLEGALKGYMRVLRLVHEGKTTRNRSAASTATKRRFGKICGSQSWFKVGDEKGDKGSKPGGRKGARNRQKGKVEAVMFVPYTEGGNLKRELGAMEERLGLQRKFRYVERTGRSMAQILTTKDPWAGACGREDCFICTTGEGGTCMAQSAIYKVTCLKCKEKGEEAQYWGETGRTCYDRGAEHLQGIKNKSASSTFWRHHQETHGEDDPPSFQMERFKTVKGNLARQSLEGRLIDNFKGKYPLNNKGEWGHNQAPKLVLEGEETKAGTGAWKGRKRARVEDPSDQGEEEMARDEGDQAQEQRPEPQGEPDPGQGSQDTPIVQGGKGDKAFQKMDNKRPLTIKQILAKLQQSGKTREKNYPGGEKAKLGLGDQESCSIAEQDLSEFQNDGQLKESSGKNRGMDPTGNN